MATGVLSEGGFIAAETDVDNAGALEWGRMTRMAPTNPLVATGGGYGPNPMQPDQGLARIVTMGPAAGGRAGPVSGAIVNKFDDWRDLFDFKGSPTPWVLLFLLGAIGLISARVSARVGPARASAGVG